MGSIYVFKPLSTFLYAAPLINIDNFFSGKFLVTLRIEQGAARCEASRQPLCYAPPSNLRVPKPFHSSIWCTNKATVLIPRWQKFGDKSLGQKTLGKLFQTFWKGQAFKTSFWGIEFSCLGRNQKYLKYGKKLSFGSYLVFVRPSYGVLLYEGWKASLTLVVFVNWSWESLILK